KTRSASTAASELSPTRSGNDPEGGRPLDRQSVIPVAMSTSAPSPTDWTNTMPLGSIDGAAWTTALRFASLRPAMAVLTSRPTTFGTVVFGRAKYSLMPGGSGGNSDTGMSSITISMNSAQMGAGT